MLPEKSWPVDITAGPDGNLWYTDHTTNKIGKIGTYAYTGATPTEAEYHPPQPGVTVDYGVPVSGAGNAQELAHFPASGLWRPAPARALWTRLETCGRSASGQLRTDRGVQLSEVKHLHEISTGSCLPHQCLRRQSGDVWVTEVMCGNSRSTTTKASSYKQFLPPEGKPAESELPRRSRYRLQGRSLRSEPGPAAHERIWGLSESGAFITNPRSPGAGAGQVRSPRGIAIEEDGNIWVADTATTASTSSPPKAGGSGRSAGALPMATLNRKFAHRPVRLESKDPAKASSTSRWGWRWTPGAMPSSQTRETRVCRRSQANRVATWASSARVGQALLGCMTQHRRASTQTGACGYPTRAPGNLANTSSQAKTPLPPIRWAKPKSPPGARKICRAKRRRSRLQMNRRAGQRRATGARPSTTWMNAGASTNVATPSDSPYASVSTTEYNEFNDVTRTLTPDNRVRSLEAGKGFGPLEAATRSAEESKRVDTESVYSGEHGEATLEPGTELIERKGPQHMVKLMHPSKEEQPEVLARERTTYRYDEEENGKRALPKPPRRQQAKRTTCSRRARPTPK